MVAFCIPERRIIQPQKALSIDWSDPLTKGLLGSFTIADPGVITNTPATIQGNITKSGTSTNNGWSGAYQGSNNYVRVERGPFSYTQQVTFEALVYVRSFQTTVFPYISGVIGQYQSTGGGTSYTGPVLRFNPDATLGNAAKPCFIVTQSGVEKTASSSTTVSANTLVHLLGTYNGTELAIYINGVKTGSLSVSGAFDNHASNFISLLSDYVADSSVYSHNRCLDGNLYLARIYNVGKTAAEAKALAENPYRIYPKETFIYYSIAGGGSSSANSLPILDGLGISADSIVASAVSVVQTLSTTSTLVGATVEEGVSFSGLLDTLGIAGVIDIATFPNLIAELGVLSGVSTTSILGAPAVTSLLDSLAVTIEGISPPVAAINVAMEELVGSITSVISEDAGLTAIMDSLISSASSYASVGANSTNYLEAIGVTSSVSVAEIGQTLVSVITSLDGLVAQVQASTSLQGQSQVSTGASDLTSSSSIGTVGAQASGLSPLVIQALTNSSVNGGLVVQANPLSLDSTGFLTFGDMRIAFLSIALDSLSATLQASNGVNAAGVSSVGLSASSQAITAILGASQSSTANLGFTAGVTIEGASYLLADLQELSLLSSGVSITPTLAALDAILEGMLVAGSGVNGLHITPSRWVVREHASDVVIYQQSGKSVIHENQ